MSLPTLLQWLEYLGGARDAPPGGAPIRSALFWALWWTVLALAIWAFSGQGSRFIYIDF